MSQENSSSTDTSVERPARRGTFYQIEIVIGVAVLLATLFTAWTEPGLLPGTLTEKLNHALTLQSTISPTGSPTESARTLPTIGIVAGHSGNGNDVGAVCPDELGGIKEVDINMDISTRVRDKLVKTGYNVDLLTEFDPRLEGYKGLALVSIHADSCKYVNEEATGFKVAPAMSTRYPEQATRLTNCILERYKSITGLSVHPSVTMDMTDYHAFFEIDQSTPATIIEVGFMNKDRRDLVDRPDVLADGIVAGILCYVLNEDLITENTSTP